MLCNNYMCTYNYTGTNTGTHTHNKIGNYSYKILLKKKMCSDLNDGSNIDMTFS